MTNASTTETRASSNAARAGDLRIVDTRTLRGPNVAQLAPVIIAELRAGSLATSSPADEPAFMTRLLDALPAVAGEVSATGAPPAVSRLPRSWGDALVRVTCELQRMAGSPPTFGRVLLDRPHEDRWTVSVGFEEEALALEALRQGERVLRDCLRGDDPEIHETVEELARQFHTARPSQNALLIMEAARRRGISVRRSPDDGMVQLGLGKTLHRVRSTMTDATSAIAAGIAADAMWTRKVLRRAGIRVPDGDAARTLQDALDLAEDIGFPVVLKSLHTRDDRRASGRIDSQQGVRDAWAAAPHTPAVLVERFAEGVEHRVIVVNRRVIACSRRMTAEPGAGGGYPPGVTVNMSTGETFIDVTAAMHPANKARCELAAGVVGLDVAGIGVISPDIAVPFDDNGAMVVSVKSGPDIRMHVTDASGALLDLPGAILDMLYPPGAPVTIPVFAVTGTNGKTTTTRLIAHLYRNASKQVGYTTTDGVYFEEHLLLEGDLTGPFAANIILSHPDVEVAVIETARGGIVRAGLGFDECDVGVVLNVTSDHLGIGDIDTLEQLADVKAVIPAVVKPSGYAVLNADDPLVFAMRDRTPGNVALFSAKRAGENVEVERHIEQGGIAGRIEMEEGVAHFVIRDGERRLVIASVQEVPLTFGGAARFQFENILAAASAAYVQGMPIGRIRGGLLTFTPSVEQTPGRLNIFDTQRGRVIHDYAHNAAAITGLLDFVARMPAVHRMAIISVPGDRRDEDLREVGSRAAAMDYVIFKEHEPYRRGRKPGEGAALLTVGLLDTGYPPERIATFDNEHDAVQHAIGLMRPGDVVALIADSPKVLELFDPYR